MKTGSLIAFQILFQFVSTFRIVYIKFFLLSNKKRWPRAFCCQTIFTLVRKNERTARNKLRVVRKFLRLEREKLENLRVNHVPKATPKFFLIAAPKLFPILFATVGKSSKRASFSSVSYTTFQLRLGSLTEVSDSAQYFTSFIQSYFFVESFKLVARVEHKTRNMQF